MPGMGVTATTLPSKTRIFLCAALLCGKIAANANTIKTNQVLMAIFMV
jgi:hypothetical protein